SDVCSSDLSITIIRLGAQYLRVTKQSPRSHTAPKPSPRRNRENEYVESQRNPTREGQYALYRHPRYVHPGSDRLHVGTGYRFVGGHGSRRAGRHAYLPGNHPLSPSFSEIGRAHV